MTPMSVEESLTPRSRSKALGKNKRMCIHERRMPFCQRLCLLVFDVGPMSPFVHSLTKCVCATPLCRLWICKLEPVKSSSSIYASGSSVSSNAHICMALMVFFLASFWILGWDSGPRSGCPSLCRIPTVIKPDLFSDIALFFTVSRPSSVRASFRADKYRFYLKDGA